ncbi:MAG: ACT domain-containing protein [Verrucomicrobiae bacterium]|nr:ACT domain-containing protein [Verrucomicrobiae bacterium]
MKTRFPHAYVLNVMADDRPGIIAAVSGVIVAFGGNIDACSQTVLGGYFTQILVVSFPEAVDTGALMEQIQRAAPPGGALQVVARPYVPPSAPAVRGPSERFVITALGKDKPGVIHRFSQYLAGKDINVVDLYWDCAGEDFVLIAQAEIPKRWELAMLQADLEEIGREEGFNVRIQHENIFVATNQLRLYGGHH